MRPTLDDILDFAILWAPIGGPTTHTLETKFNIGLREYTQLLDEAVQKHQSSPASRYQTARGNIYAPSILAGIAAALRHSITPHNCPAVSATVRRDQQYGAWLPVPAEENAHIRGTPT